MFSFKKIQNETLLPNSQINMKEVLMILLQYYNVEEKYLDDNDDEQIVLVWQINIFEYLLNQFRTNLWYEATK